MKLGNNVIEESVLSAVDDPPIGDDPDIEGIHGDGIESCRPNEQEPQAREEKEKRREVIGTDKGGKCCPQNWRNQGEQDEEKKPDKNHKRMPAEKQDDLLSLFLSVKGIT